MNAGLSTTYTNHCIHASTVTQLDVQGFEARLIMAVSGHKSENSIKSYSFVCPDNKKREMFDALASKAKTVTESNKPQQKSVPTDVQALQNANFNIEPIFPDDDEDPLETENLLQIIDKIEKENSQLAVVPATPPKERGNVVPSVKQDDNQLMNMNLMNIQNFNRASPFPHMFFPHSNVTINYNINQK